MKKPKGIAPRKRGPEVSENTLRDSRIEMLEGQVCVLAIALRAFARESANMDRVVDAMDEILNWQIDEKRIRELIESPPLLAPDGTRTN